VAGGAPRGSGLVVVLAPSTTAVGQAQQRLDTCGRSKLCWPSRGANRYSVALALYCMARTKYPSWRRPILLTCCLWLINCVCMLLLVPSRSTSPRRRRFTATSLTSARRARRSEPASAVHLCRLARCRPAADHPRRLGGRSSLGLRGVLLCHCWQSSWWLCCLQLLLGNASSIGLVSWSCNSSCKYLGWCWDHRCCL